jgi:ketosteroid isomerase-like protein
MSDPHYAAAKEAARANREFYRAFERLDLAAMRALWLDAPWIQCIHPGGEVLVGPERVHGSWQVIFENTQAIHFEIADLSIQVIGELAWATNIERIRPSDADAGVVTEIAATNLYMLRDGEWKLALHHASPVARRFFTA